MKRLLYAVVLINLLFLWNQHAAPFGGYLAFSESFYSIQAANLEFTGIWKPVVPYTSRIDFNIPPLYTISNYLLHRGAQTPANVRLLPILLNVLNILLVYKIARELSGNETTGVVVGILYTSLPITSILALTNIPDTFMVTWLLLAYFFHIRSEYHFSFLAIAFGIVTKQPAAILGIILLIDFYRKERQLRWMTPLIIYLMFSFLAMFYFVHIATGSIDDILYNVGDRAGVARIPGAGQLAAMILEAGYATGFIGALIFLSTKVHLNSVKNDLLTQIFLAYGVFFLFYHHHSYYMLPAVVFGVLQLSRLYNHQRAPIFIVALILTVPIAYDLVSSSRGFNPGFNMLDCQDYIVSESLMSYHWPVFKYYCPDADIYTCEEAEGKNINATLRFGTCNSNPNWFRPAKKNCEIFTIDEDLCPISDQAPTFKWSEY